MAKFLGESCGQCWVGQVQEQVLALAQVDWWDQGVLVLMVQPHELVEV